MSKHLLHTLGGREAPTHHTSRLIQCLSTHHSQLKPLLVACSQLSKFSSTFLALWWGGIEVAANHITVKGLTQTLLS